MLCKPEPCASPHPPVVATRDDGKYAKSIGIMENKMDTTIDYSILELFMGIVDKKMETAIVYWSYLWE